MNYQYHNEQAHPEHPVRNVLFSILCVIFSLAFSYLWLWPLFEFEYTWLAITIAALTLLGALIGGIVSFKRSHRAYFAHRRSRKTRRYR